MSTAPVRELLKPEESKDAHHREHCVGRRFFAGPIPRSVALAHASAEDDEEDGHALNAGSLSDEVQDNDESTVVNRLVNEHGERIFKQLGGQADEWGPQAAQTLRNRLLSRVQALHSGEWRRAFALRRRNRQGRSLWQTLCGSRADNNDDGLKALDWVGTSFEVGELLGVYMFSSTTGTPNSSNPSLSSVVLSSTPAYVTTRDFSDTPHSPANPPAPCTTQIPTSRSVTPHISPGTKPNDLHSVSSDGLLHIPGPSEQKRPGDGPSVHWDAPELPSSMDTISGYVTAPDRPRSSVGRIDTNSPNMSSSDRSLTQDVHANSSDNDLERQASHSMASVTPFLPSSASASKSKGKSFSSALRPNLGQFSLSSKSRKLRGKGKAVHYDDISEPGPSSMKPVSPNEVLARAPADAGKSSAEAAEALTSERQSSEIKMRDRMLVRAYYCDDLQELSKRRRYDDREIRYTRGLQELNWGEFLVIWRGNRLELYKDYKLPCRERYLGHKRLKYVIRLREQEVRFSVFSLVDLSFSLVCESANTSELSPTNYKTKSGSQRSTEGHDIFIFNPRTRSRSVDWIWRLWKEHFGELLSQLDINMPLLDRRIRLQLPPFTDSWKNLSHSHVVETCVKRLSRLAEWDMIMRKRLNYGTKLALCWRANTMLDWIWLDYDVEGQVRDWEVVYGMALDYPDSPVQLELRVVQHYSTHLRDEKGEKFCEPEAIEGFVFSVKGIAQLRTLVYLTSHDGYLFLLGTSQSYTPLSPAALSTFSHHSTDELRDAELARQRSQVLTAQGFWDLRDVLEVRHAMRSGSRAAPEGNTNYSVETDDGSGGEIDNSHDSSAHRSIELVLTNGVIKKFEVLSRKIADEWVSRLRKLISYWRQRHRADTRAELDLLHEINADGIPGRTPFAGRGIPLNPEEGTFAMGAFWHWCVIQGCRAILRSGKLHVKRKLKAQYTSSQLVLISGHLLSYKCEDGLEVFHARSYAISLLDAYIVSGYYAASMLPPREFNPDAPPLSRVYDDGLSTSDLEEDTVFMLWYRPQPVAQTKGDGVSTYDLHLHHGPGKRERKYQETLNAAPIPELKTKPKLLVCRARSRLERDSWCWAINCEIERLARSSRDREHQVRERGQPVSFGEVKDF